MTKFILTMQHNERSMLPIFLDHYLKFFPANCIYVIDHGAIVQSEHVGINRISIPRDRPFSEVDRLGLVKAVVSGLLRFYDWGVYADCDELIAIDYVNERSLTAQKVLSVAGFEVYREARHGSPSGRLIGILNPNMCKPLIFTELPNWNVGFHMAVGVEPPMQLSVPMSHIRFLYPDIARERMSVRRGIPDSMPENERLEGFASHWKEGEFLLAEFETLTRELSDIKTPILPFSPIARDSVLSRSEASIPGHGDVVFWGARGDYKSMKIRHDLTRQFSCLP